MGRKQFLHAIKCGIYIPFQIPTNVIFTLFQVSSSQLFNKSKWVKKSMHVLKHIHYTLCPVTKPVGNIHHNMLTNQLWLGQFSKPYMAIELIV